MFGFEKVEFVLSKHVELTCDGNTYVNEVIKALEPIAGKNHTTCFVPYETGDWTKGYIYAVKFIATENAMNRVMKEYALHIDQSCNGIYFLASD